MAAKTIKVKLVKSPIGAPPKVRLCVKGLGLRKLQQEKILENTPAVRGMIKKAIHLLAVQE